MHEFLQYLFSGVTNGAIYAVIAIGFSLLYNATRLINFAHGEFVMLGALGMVTFWRFAGLPLPVAFLLSTALVAVSGVLFERLAIRSVKRPQPIVLIIITVGASIFLRGTGMLIWGKDSYSIPPFSDHAPVSFGGAVLMPQSLWILSISLVLVAVLHLFFSRTLTGKALKASAINKRAAWLVGIPYRKMVLLAFGLSAAAGGIAGIIISPVTMNGYDMGTLLGLKGFCAAMLGGLGSLWGSLIGGVLLGILESFAVGYISSGLKDAVAFLLLLLTLYVRPGGILAVREVQRF
jgi:branched-chain amino acid transport system permease protein